MNIDLIRKLTTPTILEQTVPETAIELNEQELSLVTGGGGHHHHHHHHHHNGDNNCGCGDNNGDNCGDWGGWGNCGNWGNCGCGD